MNSNSNALYVHVPFCTKMCPYCSFYKLQKNTSLEEDYIIAIKKEASFYKKTFGKLPIHSIFLGGGTPNCLENKNLDSLLAIIFEFFDTNSLKEATSELNPEHIKSENLSILKNYGFNRLSVGIQSFNKKELQYLGREHTQKHILNAINLINEHNFNNFNLDLMFSFKNSKLEDLLYSLQETMKLNPTHISTYALSIEKNTPFHKQKESPLSSEKELDLFKIIIETLKENNYFQYEVSAFSKENYQSLHNLTYWQLNSYIGLGPSASSFFLNQHYKNSSDFYGYLKNPTKQIPTTQNLNAENSLWSDFLLTNLRLLKGFQVNTFNSRFNKDFEKDFEEPLKKLKSLQLLTVSDDICKVTQNGLYVLDSIIEEFI